MVGKRRFLSGLVAGATFAALSAGALAVHHVAGDRAREEARNAVLTEAGNLRARLEGELNATIFLVKGLARFAGANPDLRWDGFVAMAERMVTPGNHVRNVGLAPGDVVRYMYPLAGNHDALGLDIASHPEQSDSLALMKELDSAVVAGPLTLAQGEEALIIRAPVTRSDGSYWGVATVPVDHESLISAAGISSASAPDGLDLALRGRHGLGGDGDVFFGSEAVFEREPVLLDVSFQEQSWQLAAVPSDGWAAYAAPSAWTLTTGALFILGASAIAGVLTYQAQRLRRVSKRLEAMIEGLPDVGFVIDNEGCYLEAFGGRERRLYHDASGLVGYRFDDIMDPVSARRFRGAVHRALATGGLVTVEHPLSVDDLGPVPKGDGPIGRQWFQARIFPLSDDVEDRPCVLWLAYNITDRYEAEQAARAQEARIRHLALHDPLTELANRALFLDRLDRAIARAEREGHQLALLFLDLDRFKPVNDAYGHRVGDLVLQEIATRLAGVVRESDTVARHGGDEFVILLPMLDNSDAAAEAARKILDIFAWPVIVDDLELDIGGSIGISMYPSDGTTADALQRTADDAMYTAKGVGGGAFRFAHSVVT